MRTIPIVLAIMAAVFGAQCLAMTAEEREQAEWLERLKQDTRPTAPGEGLRPGEQYETRIYRNPVPPASSPPPTAPPPMQAVPPPGAGQTGKSDSGDKITKTMTLTGNQPGGFNIDAKVHGDKQKVPMERRPEPEQYAQGEPAPDPSMGSDAPSNTTTSPMDPQKAAKVGKDIFWSADKDKDGRLTSGELVDFSGQSGLTPREKEAISELINNSTDQGFTQDDFDRMITPPAGMGGEVSGKDYQPTVPDRTTPHGHGPSPSGGGFQQQLRDAGVNGPSNQGPTNWGKPSPGGSGSSLMNSLGNQLRDAGNALKKPISQSPPTKPPENKGDKDKPKKGPFYKPLKDAGDKLKTPLSQ